MLQNRVATQVIRFSLITTAIGLTLAGATHGLADQGDSKAAPASAPSPSASDGHLDKIDRGRKVFAEAGCGACHSLADAEATGNIGPSLDGNNFLTEALVKARVTDGQGPMPSFGGQLSDEEIADVAVYVTHVAAK